MRKSKFILLSALLVIGCSSPKKITTQKEETTIYTNSQLMKVLTSDSMEGRQPGTEGMEKASRYVEDYLRAVNIKPYYKEGYRDTVASLGVPAYNIVGIIDSKNDSSKYILIGAHLDHIGKNMEGQKDSVFNGANDNATGVTAVLQMANVLRKHNFNTNIIIAIFTGEEEGLIGAKHLARRLSKENRTLSYMINFEMIGVPLTKTPGKVYITGYDKSNFAEVSNKVLNENFVVFDKVDTQYGLFRMADNYPFYRQFKIPAHTISTYDFQNYAYYHGAGDEFEEIDMEHVGSIIAKTTELVIGLLEANSKIELGSIKF